MIEFAKDYLYAFDTDTIDNNQLYDRCLTIENIINTRFPITDPGWYGNATSANNQKYNLFSFPDPQLSKLYEFLIKSITPLLDDEPYVLKSWMNVYRAGQSVQWHGHWQSEFRVWHGFYCVHVGESATQYRIPGIEDIIIVPSKEGRLVIGKSDGDKHRSTPWTDPTSVRITLAFDIVPLSTLGKDHPYENVMINHFMPFKA